MVKSTVCKKLFDKRGTRNDEQVEGGTTSNDQELAKCRTNNDDQELFQDGMANEDQTFENILSYSSDDSLSCTLTESDDEIGNNQKVIEKSTSCRKPNSLNKKRSKPYRLCIFCNCFKSRLTSHIKKVPKNVSRVYNLLNMTKVEATKEMTSIRSEGIYLQNMRSPKKVVSDRKLRKSSDPQLCNLCKSFFSKSYMRRHHQKCHLGRAKSNQSFFTLNHHLEASFVTDVISKFRNDKIGNFCLNNETLYDIGKYMWGKHKHKLDKKTIFPQSSYERYEEVGRNILKSD